MIVAYHTAVHGILAIGYALTTRINKETYQKLGFPYKIVITG